ncbi:Loader and inhibitor of phage G40P [Oceanobacillus limi]|uniref:Loader and inhibitor of phage G40P n=1 Tax=Oceanobacillus limi TaxID=930131 RepID=A0A1H9Y0E6_9BACI|nr:replicative helicase loader/inhibitor [Oceanobacillus limi]SES62096.1 Loader and inhibitor of phage G40P [Oceanobacillus limi]
MNRQEAIDILETIKELYPKFEVTKRKVKMLIPQLEQMEYRLVMDKLAAYVAKSPFAPTIADIAAFPPKENAYLDKMNKWQKEAAAVPEDMKLRFRNELIRLVKEKAVHEDGEL